MAFSAEGRQVLHSIEVPLSALGIPPMMDLQVF
jgi:hypothetical protein